MAQIMSRRYVTSLIIVAIGVAVFPYISEFFARLGFFSPGAVALRYFVIPLVAVVVGVLISGNAKMPPRPFSEKRVLWLLTAALIGYVVVLTALKYAKYSSLNYELFDAGLYDHKLWRISVADYLSRFHYALFEGHFQPITLLYALLYQIHASPMLPYFFETVTLASGAIPIFLLARRVVSDDLLSLLVAATYLCYPPLHFNDILGFHPDHICLVALLWAFYFAESNSWPAMAVALLAAGLGSEQWIPDVAFFGFYLMIAKKKYVMGWLVFAIAIFSFVFLLWYLMPLYGSPCGGDSVFIGENSAYSTLVGGDISAMLSGLLTPTKIFFVLFLLGPLLFLPIISWPVCLVALPDLAKTLLSDEPLHHAVEGHYTLAMIAVFFAAYIFSIKSLIGRYGDQVGRRLVIMVSVLTLAMGVAHSPLPLSMDFWTKWGTLPGFHYEYYRHDSRTEALKKVESLLGDDPAATVELTNSAYAPGIVHRGNVKLFPSAEWRDADFIVIDRSRDQSAGSVSNEERYKDQYRKAFWELNGGKRFEKIFSESGIEAFRKR